MKINKLIGYTGVLVLILCAKYLPFGRSDAEAASTDTEQTALAADISRSEKSDVHAKELMSVRLPAGVPSQIKDYSGFTVSFNRDNHTPNYVAWELLASETNGQVPRYDKFWNDTDVEGCAFTSDYTRSGYDRGHLCPAADQKWAEQAMTDCFSMANIAPQDHALNSGAWATLEKKERLWANKLGSLIIIAGPIYEPGDKRTIGESSVRVPSAFFKAFLSNDPKSPQSIAFVYPNMHSPGNMANYAMSIDELEKLTSFDFFSALPDDTEKAVESTYNLKLWK